MWLCVFFFPTSLFLLRHVYLSINGNILNISTTVIQTTTNDYRGSRLSSPIVETSVIVYWPTPDHRRSADFDNIEQMRNCRLSIKHPSKTKIFHSQTFTAKNNPILPEITLKYFSAHENNPSFHRFLLYDYCQSPPITHITTTWKNIWCAFPW